MAFKPIDPKRDEFRRYLERAGVVEALTKVFVRIVKERPENPIEYLRHNLGDSLQQADNMAYLQSELEDSRIEIQRLRDIIESISPDALEDEQQTQSPQVDNKDSVVEDMPALDNRQENENENGVAEGSSAIEADAPPMATNEASAAVVEENATPLNDVQQTAATANSANENSLAQAN